MTYPQMSPSYAVQTIGFFGVATDELTQPCWGTWKAQLEVYPAPLASEPPREDERQLMLYIAEMAGTHADLDYELEAAGVEHLLNHYQAEGQ